MSNWKSEMEGQKAQQNEEKKKGKKKKTMNTEIGGCVLVPPTVSLVLCARAVLVSAGKW